MKATVKRTPGSKGTFKPKLGDSSLELTKLSRLDPMQRITLAKRGVNPRMPDLVAADMGIPKRQLYRTIGLAAATISRKQRKEKTLSQDDSERVLDLAALVGTVERMVEESGEPEGFDAGHWVAVWLERPQPALGGRKPAEFMDSATGRQLVSDLVARMQSGAYA